MHFYSVGDELICGCEKDDHVMNKQNLLLVLLLTGKQVAGGFMSLFLEAEARKRGFEPEISMLLVSSP